MSIKKIKEITGFSYSTISRVINGKAKEFRISDKTCKAIQDAAESLNYRPSILARGLRLKKTFMIGLLVSDIKNPFFGEIASRIETRLRRYDYSTILCNTNEVPENEEFYLQILVDRHVDGVIIVPCNTEEWIYFEQLGKEIPIVLLDRILYHTRLPWVTSDNAQAAEVMTEKLIELGYKRIAFLGGPAGTYINTVRLRGFKTAMEKALLPVDDNIALFRGYSVEAGEEMMSTVLEIDPEIEAVFCVNNMVFLGAMKKIQEHEMQKDVSVMMAGFDIRRYCNIFKRPLLCANQDLETVAETAVNLLLDKINKNFSPQNHVMVPVNVSSHRLNKKDAID